MATHTDVSASSHSQTTGSGTLLASYTYDLAGVPVSVQVGADPTTAPRYYYVFDARGDVANLTDASGNVVATYTYDTWGALTASSENIPNANGWSNPYRYDGRDGVRFDAATGLDWLSVRAYDPTLGRFLARDPLGRAPLFLPSGSANPYVYAGNNPISNIDPSGQYRAAGFGSTQTESGQATNQQMARVVTQSGTPATPTVTASDPVLAVQLQAGLPTPQMIQHARDVSHAAAAQFSGLATWSTDAVALTGAADLITGIIAAVCEASSAEDGPVGLECAYLWSRATLAAAALFVLATAVQVTSSQISQAFQNLDDPLTPDSWFQNPANLDTLQFEMVGGLLAASTLAASLILLLSYTGADGLALAPTAIIGGLGMFLTERAWVDTWMQKMRAALGYAN